MWNLKYVVRNVNDMYNYAKENSLKLLSDYSADFWQDYITNSEEYDKIFKRMFKTYVYYDQDITGDNPIEDVTEEFIDAVKGFLFVNRKRFEELYKLYTTEEEINPYYNQYLKQTRSGSRNVFAESELGARTDSSTLTSGSRTDTTVNQVMAFNSTDFVDANKQTNTKGQEIDSTSDTKGAETDTQKVNEETGNVIIMEGATSNITENARRFKDMWSGYEFYTYIFKEICKEFLLIK